MAPGGFGMTGAYRTQINPIWCPGCGNYGILDTLTSKVFPELGLSPEKISVVSGIGCSSRIPGYVNTYGFNSIHGRALPRAIGQKIASEILGKELHVIVIGGDGDLLSIGGNHLMHSPIKRIDITCLMADNHNYAMTKGQTSPTTPFCELGEGVLTSETFNPQVDPLRNMLSYMVSVKSGFLAQGLATNPEHLAKIVKEAIVYKGFAFVNIQTVCPTFNTKEWQQKLKDKNFGFYLEEGKEVELPNGEKWIHDPKNEDLAWRLLKVPINERPYYGIIWRGPELEENYVARIRRLHQEHRQKLKE